MSSRNEKNLFLTGVSEHSERMFAQSFSDALRLLALNTEANGIRRKDFRSRQQTIRDLVADTSIGKPQDANLAAIATIRSILTINLAAYDTSPLSAVIPSDLRERNALLSSRHTMSEQSFAREMQIYLLQELNRHMQDSPADIYPEIFLGSNFANAEFAHLLLQRPPDKDFDGDFSYGPQRERLLVEVFHYIADIAASKKVRPQIPGNFIDVLRSDQIIKRIIQIYVAEPATGDVSPQLLHVFNVLLGDHRFYTDKDGRTVKNSDKFRSLMQDDEELTKTIRNAVLRQEFGLQIYRNIVDVLAQGSEKKPDSLEEESKIAVAEMDKAGIHLPQPEGFITPSSIALGRRFKELSPEELLKVVMVELGQHRTVRKEGASFLLRAIVRDALERNPQLFNGHKDLAEAVFAELDRETRHESKSTRVLPEVKAKIDERVSQDAPIVYDFWDTGLGDIILAAPAMREVINEISRRGSSSQIYFIVRPTVSSLMGALLKQNNSNVTVVGLSSTKAAEGLMEDILQPSESLPAGILFGYRTGASTIATLKNAGVVVQSLSYFTDHNQSSLVRLREEEVERAFSIPRKNNADRDANFWALSDAMRTYIEEYISSDEQVSTVLNGILGTEGFENGYITIISSGSMATKDMTPEIMQMVADHLHAYSRKKGVGVVYLDTNFANNSSTSDLLEPLKNRGIACIPIKVNKTTPIEYSLALLARGLGSISPDTFLQHAFSLCCPTKPKMTISVDADVDYWRFPKSRTIAAMHPIAHAARVENDRYAINASLLLMQIMNPLREHLVTGRRNTHNSLLITMQRQFASEIHNGLEEFVSQLAIL